MRSDILNFLMQNPDYFHFMREHSQWHRHLNRYPDELNNFIVSYKTGRRKRFIDRLEDFQMMTNIITNMPPTN